MALGYTIFVISFLFITAGLIWVVCVVQAHIPPEGRRGLYSPLFLFVVGTIGTLVVIIAIGLFIFSTKSLVTQMREADKEVTCSQMFITDEFNLIVSKLQNGREVGYVVASDSGKKIFYDITKYAIVDRYMIGISEIFYSLSGLAVPRYCWFDLITGAQRCFDSSDHDRFIRSLNSLGIPEEPAYLSLAEHCAINSCQPCTLPNSKP